MTITKYAFLILLISLTAGANSLNENKAEYKTSCQRTALTFLTDSKEFSDNKKTILAAIMTCKEIISDLDSGKKWDLVKNPKFDGCSDAIRLLIPKGSTEALEKSQRAKYCAQHLNL